MWCRGPHLFSFLQDICFACNKWIGFLQIKPILTEVSGLKMWLVGGTDSSG